jgi:hypothetical protein
MNTKQTQLRIKSSVKDRFQEACRSRNSTMTSEIVRFMKLDFPDFTRHLLAWKNSLLQTALEKHLQCDYVV